MKVSIIFTACNSGKRYVSSTVSNALRSILPAEYEILVVDDHSTDDCCQNLPSAAKVLRPPRRLGCTGARSWGANLATGDVLIISDPHFEYPDDALYRLAKAAYRQDGIWQPDVNFNTGRDYNLFRIGFNRPWGLAIIPSSTRLPNPVLYGCLQVMNRETYEHLGHLPALPGYWGWAEMFYTTLVYRRNLRVYQMEGSVCNHLPYRSRTETPFDVPEGHMGMNAHWYYATCLPYLYQERAAAYLERQGFARPERLFTSRFFKGTRALAGAGASEDWFLSEIVGLRDCYDDPRWG